MFSKANHGCQAKDVSFPMKYVGMDMKLTESSFLRLVCGDVKGNFKALFNKVDNINSKSGPFEFLLCVGDFFGDDNGKLEAYKNGNLKSKLKKFNLIPPAHFKLFFILIVAVPTYILGPTNESLAKEYENVENGEICPNLTYLGRRGLYTSSAGVKIAYVSGLESKEKDSSSEWAFNAEDIKSVTNACLASNHSAGDYRGVDVLMTSQWPEGVRENEKNTSRLISTLSSEIKPRYHFCGLNDDFYEPPPFRNVARPNSQYELATRFISLASVGNAAKKKWIYAFNVVPVDKMRVTDLIQKTTNEIPCPYDSMNLFNASLEGAINDQGSAQFFYDMNAFPGEDGRKRKHGFNQNDRGQKKPKQPAFDQGEHRYNLGY